MHPLRLLVPVLVACTPEAEPLVFPPDNPFLADSAWPITHGSPHAQSSTAASGLESADAEVQYVSVGLPSVTLAFEPGGDMLWGSNPLEVYRLRVADPPVITARVRTGGGLADLVSGAYSLLDRDGRFFTTQAASLRAYEADGPDDIAEAGRLDLADPAPGETLRGLGMTYDGVVVAVSSTGRVVAVDRETVEAISEVQLAGEVSNSIAIDAEGGIYVVTSEAMHRVQWTGDALSTEPADGAWAADYETGPEEAIGGRLGTGSGSTPSLMSVGDDALVVITDAQPLMHVVAFWRDEIPEGWEAPSGTDPRTAALAPITFGDPDAATSVSEQSVLVMGAGAVVVNNDYGEGEGFEPVAAGIAPPGIEKFVWDPRADTLTADWFIPDISCPNGIPSASGATGLMYCVGKRGESWTVEAVDWWTGEPAFHVPTGTGTDFNTTYAATEVGPDGEIWTGTFTGVVRVKPRP